MKYGALPDVDVLIAGHHGSKYASSNACWRAVPAGVRRSPSVGYNSYGHPAPETLARLERRRDVPFTARTDGYHHLPARE